MLKRFPTQALKWLFIFFAIWCFFAVLPLPIGYYTLLRFITTIGSLLAITLIYLHKNKLLLYIFIIITIFFNPIVPIYLQKKGVWIPLDILTGCAFLYLAFLNKNPKAEEEPELRTSLGTTDHVRIRDRIITNKKIN